MIGRLPSSDTAGKGASSVTVRLPAVVWALMPSELLPTAVVAVTAPDTPAEDAGDAGDSTPSDDDRQMLFGWASIVTKNGVPVIDKQVSRGKVTQHRLRLAPWGPVTAPEHVDVDPALYQLVEPGGTEIWYGSRGPTSTGGVLDRDKVI